MTGPTPVADDATATAEQLLERAADDYATGWGSARADAEGSSD